MSKQLYEEALAEVKQLKQLAEDNAKKAILDEVTPRIRALIESQLVGEVDNNLTEETEESELKKGQQILTDTGESDSQVKEDETSEVNENLRLVEFKRIIRKLGQRIELYGQSSTYSKVNPQELAEALKATYVLVRESLSESHTKDRLEEKLNEQYTTLLRIQEQKMNKKRSLAEASLNVKIDGFDDEMLSDDALEKLKIEIVPDLEEEESQEEDSELMTPESDSEEKPEVDSEEGSEKPEGSSEEEEESEDLFGPTETKQEGKRMNGLAMLRDDTVVEIDEGMLRREIARMKALREGKVEGKSPVGKKMTPKVLGSFGGGHEEGDPWLDGEVTTESLDEMMDEAELEEAMSDLDEENQGEGYSLDEDEAQGDEGSLDEYSLDEMMDEEEKPAHKAEKGHEESKHGKDGMDEEALDELVSELSLDEEIDETQFLRTADEHGPESAEGHYTSASATPGSSLDTNESRRKLTRVLETRKAAAHKAQRAQRVMEAARKVGNRAAFTNAKTVYTEATKTYALATKAARVLSESLKRGSNSHDAAQTAALRKQLAETNLFNAKLLYTNKLLQNESLTPRQKVSVIEKLDEARSLREAKLVYESLVRTIASGKGSVNEGADRQVLGSASRATRPASTVSLNEGIEASRWAKLAGITK